jgi:hypothetical protein
MFALLFILFHLQTALLTGIFLQMPLIRKGESSDLPVKI